MLKKAQRLTANTEFERVLAKGRVIATPFFLLKYLAAGAGENRFGFVVSKKISLRATERNTVKRRMREAVRVCGALPQKGYEAVFIARKQIMSLKPGETRKQISEALRRIQ